MKKYLVLLLMTVSLFVVPFTVKAGTVNVLGDDYETKNLKETLEAEDMKLSANYSENSDQITIYLFRGQGCSFCRAFLTFINSIVGEYGKYFKLVSFEVWNNEDNYYLFNRTALFLDKEPAQGVPYIVIGDKVFPGYADTYNDGIKEAIQKLYDTPKASRYDVFAEAKKGGFPTIDEAKAELEKLYGSNPEGGSGSAEEYSTTSNSKGGSVSELRIILFTLGFVVVGTAAVIIFDNYKFNKIEEKLSGVSSKLEKPEKAEAKTKKKK